MLDVICYFLRMFLKYTSNLFRKFTYLRKVHNLGQDGPNLIEEIVLSAISLSRIFQQFLLKKLQNKFLRYNKELWSLHKTPFRAKGTDLPHHILSWTDARENYFSSHKSWLWATWGRQRKSSYQNGVSAGEVRD